MAPHHYKIEGNVMRRFGSLKRKPASRSPSKKVFVFGEGAVTERDYFAAMQEKMNKSLIQINYRGGIGVPLTVVEAALQHIKDLARTRKGGRKNSFEKNDEIWVIFDRDEHPSFVQAKDICEIKKINFIYCDPCFELWLVLHFQDCDAPTHRKEAQEMAKTLVPGYNPKIRKTGNFDTIMPSLCAAEIRAKKQRLRRREEGKDDGNPSTNFYEFTEKFREFFCS